MIKHYVYILVVSRTTRGDEILAISHDKAKLVKIAKLIQGKTLTWEGGEEDWNPDYEGWLTIHEDEII